jgi:deoxyribonuclease IV
VKRIGPHVHTTGGVQNAPANARQIGATAFGLFTRNQRRWVAKPLDTTTIESFTASMHHNGYSPSQVLVHDGYLINIGSPDKAMREQSYSAFLDEVQRCGQLGLTALNIHPGSHLGLVPEDECLSIIAGEINRVLDATKNVTVVLETTAGQGSNVGYRFDHLASIIDRVADTSRIGFCIDTCHIFAAGYDLRTPETYDATMNEIDRTIGFRYLRGVHLNDTKTPLGSRVDRHQSIGKGMLGIEPFRLLMNDKRFEEVPMILETIDETLWPEEIRMLYSLVQQV